MKERLEQARYQPKSVNIVDEAGLMSVRQMRDLCRLAKTYDYRLLLVGDIKQHGSVEAGDALRAIQKFTKVPVARLTQIRRQKDPELREAVADLAAGDAAGALTRFQKLRAVQEIPNPITLFRKAAEDYVQSIRSGKSCLVVCPVWEEIWTFVHEARARLRAEGILAVEERVLSVTSSYGFTREACRQVETYEPNDVLAFHRESGGFAAGSYASVIHRQGKLLYAQREDGTGEWIDPRKIGGFDVQLARQLSVAVGERLPIEANDKPAKLKNGDLVEVAGFGEDGAILLKDGRQIPSRFRQYTYGYATTSHASQGKTVDRGILVMGETSITFGNLKQAYVSNSRFRESQMIYTSDLKAAREAMGRYGDRLLVSEVMPSKPKPVSVAPPSADSPRPGMLSGRYGGVRTSTRVLLGRSLRFPSAIKSTPAQSWAKAA